jgi:Zn-dependent protease with chaperone function
VVHDDLIASARRRIRLVTAAGVALLAVTITVLIFPMALVLFAAFAALGARWGFGWALVWWSLGVSAAFGVIGAAGVFAWSLARSERHALEFVRAWPMPGRDTPPPPRLPDGAYRRARNLIDGLSLATGVLPPSCAMVIDDAPNCLTVGRQPTSAWIVVTTGLLDSLPRAELEAVLAYEIGRVAELGVSLDTVVYACTRRVFELWAGVFDDLDEMTFLLGPLALLATPLVVGSALLRAVVLRTRARLSDGLAVRYCRNPVALARGLRRIVEDPREVRGGDPGNAHLWLEYPHTRSSRWFLRTHRILPERVRRIENLARLPEPS